jgi:hypothetical protein
MKHILLAISAVLLMFAMSGVVCAAEHTGFEAGIKLWFNDWTHDEPGFGSVTSDTALLIGPAIKAELGNRAFVEASYLAAGSNYRFSDPAVAGNAERRDIDLAAGYRIIPEFSLLAGYKNSRFDNRATSSKAVVSGPIIGVHADLPMDPYLAFYIGSNYLFTRFREDGSADGFQEDSPGWTFELGFKHSMTRVFTGSFGYKYETNTGNDSNVRDSFSGITLSGMIVF